MKKLLLFIIIFIFCSMAAISIEPEDMEKMKEYYSNQENIENDPVGFSDYYYEMTGVRIESACSGCSYDGDELKIPSGSGVGITDDEGNTFIASPGSITCTSSGEGNKCVYQGAEGLGVSNMFGQDGPEGIDINSASMGDNKVFNMKGVGYESGILSGSTGDNSQFFLGKRTILPSEGLDFTMDGQHLGFAGRGTIVEMSSEDKSHQYIYLGDGKFKMSTGDDVEYSGSNYAALVSRPDEMNIKAEDSRISSRVFMAFDNTISNYDQFLGEMLVDIGDNLGALPDNSGAPRVNMPRTDAGVMEKDTADAIKDGAMVALGSAGKHFMECMKNGGNMETRSTASADNIKSGTLINPSTSDKPADFSSSSLKKGFIFDGIDGARAYVGPVNLFVSTGLNYGDLFNPGDILEGVRSGISYTHDFGNSNIKVEGTFYNRDDSYLTDVRVTYGAQGEDRNMRIEGGVRGIGNEMMSYELGTFLRTKWGNIRASAGYTPQKDDPLSVRFSYYLPIGKGGAGEAVKVN